MPFTPNQVPGTILSGEFAADTVGAIVGPKPIFQVVSVADIELALGILENVDPEHKMAPEIGLEPITRRLTAGCSTIELLWNPRSAESTN